MQIGFIGLGRMGGGMVHRLRDAGHEVLAYDADASLSELPSVEQLVTNLTSPRVVWLMVPHDRADAVLHDILPHVHAGDVVIDGGNSYYRESMRRAQMLGERGLNYLDVGTSGGIWGRDAGYCLMIGGPREAFLAAEPAFEALAPEGGYAHVGPSGAGHYTKMVHNGIEYALLQAYAEGFDLLQASDFGLDLRQITAIWNRGGVVRSWLLELAQLVFEGNPDLEGLRGYVDDTGEGRWATIEGAERGIAVDSIALATFRRFISREDNAFSMRFLAAMRREFGGHAVRET